MTWYLRFLLGLPARNVDLLEIQKDFPELLKSSDNNFARILDVTGEDIRDWLKSSRQSSENGHRNTETCNKIDCPVRQGQSSFETFQEDEEDEQSLFHLMSAGGGLRKEPLKSFLNLVKHVHAKADLPKRIYITDRFLMMNEGEDGSLGGHVNLIKYLQALRLDRISSFTLLRSANRAGSETSRGVWESYIRASFPNCHFDFFSGRYNYHDRFYVVDHGRGDLRGVFGPSLNGLTSDSVVLMGEIERGVHGLDLLVKMLQ